MSGSDRELLELAAKAAGIEVRWADRDIFRGSFLRRLVPKPEEPCSEWLYWRPLNDDGDALRLAVKLRLCIDPSASDTLGVGVCSCGEFGDLNLELVNGDPYAATRRAIVRAAAEIGRSMP